MKISIKLIIGVTTLTSLVLVSYGIFSIVLMKNKLTEEVSQNIQFQTEQLSSTQSEMDFSTDVIKEGLLSSYDRSIKNIVDVAISIITHYHGLEQSGVLTREEAQATAKNVLRDIRYNGEVGYLWIDDENYSLLVHPLFPKNEGQNRYELEDPSGFKLIQSIVGNAISDDTTFTDYLWPKPGQDLSVWVKKRGYSEYFSEWGWIPGTGNYIDEIDLEVEKYKNRVETEFSETVERAGHNGVTFVVNNDTGILFHSDQNRTGTQLDETDLSSGEKLIDLIKENETGFLSFSLADPNTGKESKFIAYSKYNEENGSYVVVGKNKTLVFADIKFMTILMILSLLLSVFLIAFFILYYVRKITNPINELAEAAKTISDGNYDKPIDIKSTDEIGFLADTLESMRVSIWEHRKDLETSNKDLEKIVAERTRELKQKTLELQKQTQYLETENVDLGRFNKMVIDRELKMIELKNRIKELEG